MEIDHEGGSSSALDDLVLVVDVEPGPTFRIAAVGGRPVARGAVSAHDATGVTLGPLQTTTPTTMRELELAWRQQRPHRYAADRPEGTYDVYVTPLAGAEAGDRLLVHMVLRSNLEERRRHLVNAAIVDALPGSVALLDPDGVIRAVNAGWIRFGLERAEDGRIADAGTSYLEVTDRAAVDDPSALAAAQAIRSVLAGGVDLAASDYPSEGADESEWFTMRVAPVDIDGERWAVVSHEDVTALRHALDRWHSTFSNAAVATLIVDRRGTIIDANGAFAELLGVDLPSTIGRSMIELVHPDQLAEIRERMTRAHRGEPVSLTIELRLLRPDGTNVVAMLHPSTIPADHRGAAVVQLIDLTSQRRAETRLALHRELLELVAAGTPLADVATAVAINVPGAIDGATGAVVLCGTPPYVAPGHGADPTTADGAWRVPIDQARPDIGELVLAGPRRERDDEEAAAMLASVVRLAVQRDEVAGALPRRRTRTGPSLPLRSTDERAADDLRRGLDAGEVGVHYQPIIDLRSGATVSLEALVRWEHPTRGFVPPPELIEVAEQCGLIKQVGALVLTTACRDLAAWRGRAQGRADLSVAVNLSAIQLADPDLVALIELAIASTGLEPSALVVEITESVVVDDVDLVAASLAELRSLGVRVAIDDFGTGYSSLLYLKRFPADVLKVDRSFVQGLGIHDGDTAIVEAVVSLGHRLGLEVVAEGVETDAQLVELRRRHCDQAQGYLLQRPVAAAELGPFLDRRTVDLGPEPSAMPARELDAEQLLRLVSHELSTPLSVIGGHAELLADLMRRDDDSPSAVIDALERNIRNLDDLLRSLSGLSQALSAPGQRSSVELGAFVEQAVQDLGPLLKQHDLHIMVPAPLHADVEPVALRQILTNLLSNAVKFTEPGTRIDVEVRTGLQHEIAVVDHGAGVPPDRVPELFGRYARLGARARGLGLGLHLSRALARRQGGDLVHARTPGGGATFILRIPR